MNEERKFRRELRKLKIAVWFIVLCAIVNPFFTIKQDVENSKNTPRQKAKEISFSEVESAFQNKVKGEQNIDQAPRQEEQTTINDPRLLKMYATFEEIKFYGTEVLPTFYKYTKYDKADSYIDTTENNMLANNTRIVRIHYTRLYEEDINTYADALVNYEGYTKDVYFDDYFFAKDCDGFYLYVMIQGNTITYGYSEGKYF